MNISCQHYLRKAMKVQNKIILSLVLILMSSTSVLAERAGTKTLPQNASAGECFARVTSPAVYETKTQQVMVKPAKEESKIIPAKYGFEEQQVLVKQEGERLEVIPATYKTVEEKIMIKPASKKVKTIPAKYKTVSEKVVDKLSLIHI